MFYKDKLVLVTGGTGFVGSHFVEELLRQGARVRVPIHKRPLRIKDDRIETFKADLTQWDDCQHVCMGVDCIIHAAGAVSAARATVRHSMEPITANLILTSQMLQTSWSNVDRFLLFGSSTGYPPADHPVKEEEFWLGPTHPSYFGYGWMRRYLERMGELVHSQSDTKIAIVRPTAVYGRHDDFNPITSHVIPALIRRAVEKEDPFVVWGNPDVVRDFLHITELLRGSRLVIQKFAKCDPVNIGYGKGITIGEVVDLVLYATGYPNVRVEFDESKPTTIPFRIADITKAHKLGFTPGISLQSGLCDTVEWYRNESLY